MTPREELYSRIETFIDARADGSRDDAGRDALLAALGEYQAATVEPYQRLCLSMRPSAPGLVHAVPTDVFRFARVASHPASLDARIFRTSGTTQTTRGEHAFRTLALYDRAAKAAARRMLFPDREAMPLVILAPAPDEAPDSSLSYMLGRFAEWFGERATWVVEGDRLLADTLALALERAERERAPVALLGTSFAFVHALDGLEGRSFELPAGSRVMQTGGFKGRARAVPQDALRRSLSSRFGIPEALIVAEYGMTEMSSQLYETSLRDAVTGESTGGRRLWIPGWVRAIPVEPDTLRPVAPEELGILRIDDCANLDSVSAIQTSDLARTVDDGIEVVGRAAGATPRGCSIAADAALGGKKAC